MTQWKEGFQVMINASLSVKLGFKSEIRVISNSQEKLKIPLVDMNDSEPVISHCCVSCLSSKYVENQQLLTNNYINRVNVRYCSLIQKNCENFSKLVPKVIYPQGQKRFQQSSSALFVSQFLHLQEERRPNNWMR